jgi:pimeloyl-ACP methyl ester carboxylesterase
VLVHLEDGACESSEAHRLLSAQRETPSSGAYALWGTASGAVAALRIAVQTPERVSALVLESPNREPEVWMRDVHAPVLLLLGTHDAAASPGLGARYKALLSNCHLVWVYDAGRDIAAKRPEAFADVVADFLERREAFVINRTPSRIHP